MAESKMLVFSNAVAGQDEEFNEWYDTKHLAEVVAVPGVSSGQRFELVPAALPGGNAAAPAHRYLAVYELSDDPDKIVQAFVARAGNGEIELSKALDVSTLAVSVWRARGAGQTAD
ncbi:DUF4286 family protein [Nocardia abscessus]|uniref:DUF4286 family protein n=1 Tax=Nocardia abscessus TaxID=120957 RepID=UPI0024549CE4|nr:DUF4286 family protein [Nocardia abscessus]